MSSSVFDRIWDKAFENDDDDDDDDEYWEKGRK